MFTRVFNVVNFIYEKMFRDSTSTISGNNDDDEAKNMQKIAFGPFSNYLWNGSDSSMNNNSNTH